MKRIRTAFPRRDRARPGLTLDELAARVGTTRFQLIAYEKGTVTPEPARITQLAAALECDVTELTGGQAAALAGLRRAAGLTLRTAAARARPLLARHRLRCSRWLLGELEAGRMPPSWTRPPARARLQTVLAAVYGQPEGTIAAALPAAPATPTPVTTYTLVGRSPYTWYAPCPACSLASAPSAVDRCVDAEGNPDWSSPAVLTCTQCGTQHDVTPFQLLPHDDVHACPRPGCGKTTPVPARAAEVMCEHCGLYAPGPAAVRDPALAEYARQVRGRHTRELQATVVAAKRRYLARGGRALFLLDAAD
jgi:transcriptional regulator with XRE-family HTH domain